MHKARLVGAGIGITLAVSCGYAGSPGPNAGSPAASAAALDEDGVQRLYPTAPGASFRLGDQDPNRALIERNIAAEARSEGRLRYWNVVAYDLTYSSGGTGRTSRLHIYASGGRQDFTWRNQKGYLSSPADVRNQELTAYLRVHDIFDPSRAAVSLKLRGGAHSASNADLASCVMLTLTPGGATPVTRFGKELEHPDYDYVTLQPLFPETLRDGRFVGMKLVSYASPSDPTRVVNRLYLDADPFDAAGRPANRWQLFSEYVEPPS